MRDDQRMITDVVRRMRQGDGEDIAVVLCSDGTYGISRNGSLLGGLKWTMHELDECISFAERFSQTDKFSDGDEYTQTAS
jgi:hypothetical protein